MTPGKCENGIGSRPTMYIHSICSPTIWNWPKLNPGDLVGHFQSGAYGFTASPQAFLGHPQCVEVLV
jgi:hypothetical protein